MARWSKNGGVTVNAPAPGTEDPIFDSRRQHRGTDEGIELIATELEQSKPVDLQWHAVKYFCG